MTPKQAAEVRAGEELGIIPDSGTVFGKAAGHFNRAVEEYRSITETLKSLEEEKKRLQGQIQKYFTDADCKTVTVDGAKVTLVQNQGRSTIDKMKLIEHGVAATVIAECTVTGAPFEYVKITQAKD